MWHQNPNCHYNFRPFAPHRRHFCLLNCIGNTLTALALSMACVFCLCPQLEYGENNFMCVYVNVQNNVLSRAIARRLRPLLLDYFR